MGRGSGAGFMMAQCLPSTWTPTSNSTASHTAAMVQVMAAVMGIHAHLAVSMDQVIQFSPPPSLNPSCGSKDRPVIKRIMPFG